MQNDKKIRVFLFTFLFLFLFSFSFASAGVQGASRIPYSSEASDFNRPNGVWVIPYIDDGFSTDQINAYLQKGADLKDAKQSFSINVAGTNNYCRYDILREASRLDIFTIGIASKTKTFYAWEKNYDGLVQVTRDMQKELNCLSDPFDSLSLIKESWRGDSATLYCYTKRDDVAKIGSLQNLKYVTETKWKVQADGKTPVEDIISNSETGSGVSARLGNDVLVRFQGLLSSGETCPITATELMAYSPSFTNNWRVIDKQNYANYEAFMRGDIASYLV